MIHWKHIVLLLSSTHALRGADRYLRPKSFQGTSNAEDEDCLPCHVVRPEVLKESSPSSDNYDFRCLTPLLGGSYDSMRTSLALEGLPTDLVQANLNALEAGLWHICILTGHYQVHDKNRILLADSPVILDHSSRRLAELSSFERRRGRKSLLAVRVSSSASGISPTETVDEIEGTIFGSGTNPYQLQPRQVVVNHIATVSHGQLIYEPAVESIPGTIQNGVTEISVDAPIDSTVDIQKDILPLLVNATRDHIGTETMAAIDKIIFCLPTGANFQGDGDWTAFTYLWEPYSYFQQSRCTRLSVVMHELGHSSTGFQHSGTVGNDYDDTSGYMGYARNEIGSPLKAYNGHKHYISGWFKDRSVEINPASAANTVLEQRLVAFVHASDESLDVGDKVLIKIGDLYLQYNRAKLYNFETEEKDTVTVTLAISEVAVSVRLASLIAGQTYSEVLDGSSNSLVVAVCENTVSESDDVVDYAVVRFYQGVSDGSDLCSRQDVTDVSSNMNTISPDTAVAENDNTFDNDQEDGTGLNYPTDLGDDENGDTSDNDQEDETGLYHPTDTGDDENGDQKPGNYILERKKDSEESSLRDSPLFPFFLSSVGLLLLSVSALITYKCLHRRKAATMKPRIRPVSNKLNRKNLPHRITRELSETEDSDSSDASDIQIREAKV